MRHSHIHRHIIATMFLVVAIVAVAVCGVQTNILPPKSNNTIFGQETQYFSICCNSSNLRKGFLLTTPADEVRVIFCYNNLSQYCNGELTKITTCTCAFAGHAASGATYFVFQSFSVLNTSVYVHAGGLIK